MKADFKSITVDSPDFDRAVNEVIPAFGQKNNDEISNLCRNGLYNYEGSFPGKDFIKYLFIIFLQYISYHRSCSQIRTIIKPIS